MAQIEQTLRENIRKLRGQKNLSQEALADLAGLDRTYISGVERGVRNPTVKVLERIAIALGVQAFELIKPNC